MADIMFDFQPYETEVLAIESVIKAIRASAFTMRDFDQWREEVINRFGEAGFMVSVVWDETYAMGATECRDPIITILDRVEKRNGFDFDRQVHEITHDVLELGEGGTLTEHGLIKDVTKPVFFEKS